MLRYVLNQAASRVDVAIGAALFHRSKASRARSPTESLGHAERMRALAENAAVYDRPEHDDPDGPFFAKPAPMVPQVSRVRALAGGEVVDWTWPSGFEPLCADVAERYLRHTTNRTAAARLFLHGDRPRPTAILLHGYRAGAYAFEERSWPVEWLYEKGLDVALAVLPFHAVRAHRPGPPIFPGSDPRISNEGFRQAVLDLRTLAGHLRSRGAPAVGVMGMSLGAYTAALLATVEARLDFAVTMIPLASLSHIAESIGRLVGTPEEREAQRAALAVMHRVVSPLARPPRLAPERVLVLAAEGDRITPPSHARWLADHFHAPLETFPGGHLLQLGRGQAFRSIGRMLGRLDLLDARS